MNKLNQKYKQTLAILAISVFLILLLAGIWAQTKGAEPTDKECGRAGYLQQATGQNNCN